jgi:retinol dehydrogenase 14
MLPLTSLSVPASFHPPGSKGPTNSKEPSRQLEVLVADLSSQSQVRRLADEVLQRGTRIDVLVNNVGGY